MRKKLLSLTLILLLVAAVALGVAACNDNKSGGLAAPSIYVSKAGVVSWPEVTAAESYEVNVNGDVYPCSETTFDLLALEKVPSDGKFTVCVRSVKGEERSEWSTSYDYVSTPVKMDAPDLKVEDGKLIWTTNPKAAKVIVTVNGIATELTASVGEYDLSKLTQDAVITVQFVGNGVTSTDSDVVSIIYNVSTGTAQLAAPKNVRMEGMVLTFDAVPGADVYYMVDVYNNVFTSTSNECDLSKKNLVKSVWASDSSGKLAASEHVDLIPFTNGEGTQSNPYLISSAAELRFVEFFEAQNQAKYYKFSSDVVLDECEVGEEEVFNNFYNLGSLSGTIDGDGHKLANLTVYFSDGYSSLFDSITVGGAIKNLVIDNANFRTWTAGSNPMERAGECAVLAYTNRGTLDNVTVENSNVCAIRDGAAALVSINRGTIRNCKVEASTTVFGSNEAGGIAIWNAGTIVGCVNRAQVGGNSTVGGIAGRNNGLISQCGNEGKISASTYGGGIVGYNFNINDGGLQFSSLISQCYNYGEIDVTSFGGGIAGRNGSDGTAEGSASYANAGIFSCYNRGKISGANSLGGIVGDNYSFHQVATDLGVVNCYNSGEISVDTNALKSCRVYLSLENCSWGAADGAVFYMHFWGATGESSWPGVRMTQTTVGGKTYYYADMSIKAEDVTGVIFNRCKPTTGDIWNQSKDLTNKVSSGNLLYKIDSSWQYATTASSASLIASTPLSVGGIAGFNNMVNDCYFLQAKVSGTTLQAGVAQGAQSNKILVNGKTVQSSACEITAAQLSTFAKTLNAYANVWEDSENGPVLKWQRR